MAKKKKELVETAAEKHRRERIEAGIAARCTTLGVNPGKYLGKEWDFPEAERPEPRWELPLPDDD